MNKLARPHLAEFRQRTKELSKHNRKMARLDKKRARVLATLLAIIIVGIGIQVAVRSRQSMVLPAPHVPVIAYTGAHAHMAYMDENGEFHNAEDGHPLGQVIEWRYP